MPRRCADPGLLAARAPIPLPEMSHSKPCRPLDGNVHASVVHGRLQLQEASRLARWADAEILRADAQIRRIRVWCHDSVNRSARPDPTAVGHETATAKTVKTTRSRDGR